MNYHKIENPIKKQKIVRDVLESLPEWFEIVESREEYIRESSELTCFGAFNGGNPVGFLCLKETGKDTIELHVIGVKKEYHRKGIGKHLFLMAKDFSIEKNYSFMQVKTIKMGTFENYDKTNLFYISLGFKEFEVFPTLWDESNPCQIYVMYLK